MATSLEQSFLCRLPPQPRDDWTQLGTSWAAGGPTSSVQEGRALKHSMNPNCVSQTQWRDVTDETKMRHLGIARRQGDIEFVEPKMPTNEKKSLLSGISESQENYSCELNTEISAHALLEKNSAEKMGGQLPSPHFNVPDSSELQVPDVQKAVWPQNPGVPSKYTEKQDKLLLDLLPVQCKKEKKSCGTPTCKTWWRSHFWKAKDNKKIF